MCVALGRSERKFRNMWKRRRECEGAVLGGLLLLACVWTCSGSDSAVESMDHCSTHKFRESANTSFMQFTKEISSTEYAVLKDFKSLHCCAKGYRSIEWMKDGRPYPWAADTSSFILYPEAANQTIYTSQVQFADIGNYTCVLKNETHKMTNLIMLEVPANLPDMPRATFEPRDQTVELGESARFYCEAFVGKVGLPDARSDISWYQVFEAGQEQEIDGIQESVSRGNGQIIGSYLTIPQVEPHNYGRYLCRIQMGDSSHRLDMYTTLQYASPMEAQGDDTMLLGLIAAVLALILCLLTWYTWSWCARKNKKNQNQCQALARAEMGSPRRV